MTKCYLAYTLSQLSAFLAKQKGVYDISFCAVPYAVSERQKIAWLALERPWAKSELAIAYERAVTFGISTESIWDLTVWPPKAV